MAVNTAGDSLYPPLDNLFPLKVRQALEGKKWKFSFSDLFGKQPCPKNVQPKDWKVRLYCAGEGKTRAEVENKFGWPNRTAFDACVRRLKETGYLKFNIESNKWVATES